jgi:hypothetical protein
MTVGKQQLSTMALIAVFIANCQLTCCCSTQMTESKVIDRMEKITTRESCWCMRCTVGAAAIFPMINATSHLRRMPAAWSPEGRWIAKLDLVEQGSKLMVQEMGQIGNCGSECKTVQRAAEQIMDLHDTDVAEALYTVNDPIAAAWSCRSAVAYQ